ncbi:hypothetical protein IQ266_22320 [filamentous cyanobacterium LEGE 11480]|uniref:Uncharacterized protein n=1 Tax=Romeriopsis navalis LEGE 11480 TaxID=2777977 RepID=A0A928Z5Y6_9CYAN|nr:hypothetical protein [Romeriopsis navalis]MBE9032477.1 hypothetical protein [Romeriopsis navalis LEGE 11480]
MTVSPVLPVPTTDISRSPDSLVTHLAETALATAEAVDVLSERVDLLAQQLQQQDCQIFALGEEIKASTTQQQRCLDRVDRLTQIMEAMAQNLLTTLPFSETANDLLG